MTESACAELAQDSLHGVIHALHHAGRKLPVEAIQTARRHQKSIVPELIKVMRLETELIQRNEPSEGNAAFFALFLLAEFRATEGLPAILEAISLPEDGPFTLFGDAIHDVLPRVLISTSGDRCVEVCSALVNNPALNEYVRWSSAKAIGYLAMAGLRPRAEIMAVCQELLRDAIERKDEHAVNGLIMSLVELKPWEAAKEIELAFQRGLVDEAMIDWGSMRDYLKNEPIGTSHEYRDSPYIEDTIEELKNWASFREPEQGPPAKPIPVPRPAPRAMPSASPQARRTEHIGRNDPCPCGSGKKFKRCCGGR